MMLLYARAYHITIYRIVIIIVSIYKYNINNNNILLYEPDEPNVVARRAVRRLFDARPRLSRYIHTMAAGSSARRIIHAETRVVRACSVVGENRRLWGFAKHRRFILRFIYIYVCVLCARMQYAG